MKYVDGYVLPVPKKNLKAYQKMAKTGGKVWKDHGALEYMECVEDDVAIKDFVSFPKIIKVKPGEVVFFSFVVFKSRKHRDQVNAKVIKDPRMQSDMKKMPFDWKRMAYGGFQAIVEE